jgi:L-iditol 2-dehydrogenase
MLANLLIRPGVLKLREIDTPSPSRGEILIRVKAALTCGTDLKAFQRGHPLIPMPSVFGHEFSGIVEEVGSGVKGFSKGMEIMAVHTAPCGRCYFCKRNFYNLCEDIMKTKVLGAFAECILLPKHIVKYNVFIKPKSLSFSEAAFLEPLSCVVHSINSVKISPGDIAVIIGAGPIGLLHLILLKSMKMKVCVIEKQKMRLKKALEEKADIAINPQKEDAYKKIMMFTKNKGADVVFECTGVPEVWEDSVRFVRKGGTIVLFGGCKPGTQVTYDTGRIHYDEITLKGAFHYNPSDVAQAYKLLSHGKIKVAGLISGEYPLHDLKKALDLLAAGKGIKYAIIP